ncbi:hypothetical protein CPB85DRAFT_795658 [Mucidula mucida]|nr:hypothetical protein CPB85DRAFT_795658 [Mucidula mucida]
MSSHSAALRLLSLPRVSTTMLSLALLAGRLVAHFVLVCNELTARKRKEVSMLKIALLPLFRKIQRYSKRHLHDGRLSSVAMYHQNGRKNDVYRFRKTPSGGKTSDPAILGAFIFEGRAAGGLVGLPLIKQSRS